MDLTGGDRSRETLVWRVIQKLPLAAPIILLCLFPKLSFAAGLEDLPGKVTAFGLTTLLAGVVLGVFWLRGLRAFGLLSASFLMGISAQWYLTNPLWFPTRDLTPTTGPGLLMVLLLGTEAVLATIVLRRNGGAATLGALRDWGGWRILLLLVLLALLSVSPTRFIAYPSVSGYVLQALSGGGLAALHLAMLAALVTVPGPAVLRPASPWLWAGVALAGSAALAWFAFERVPHVEDEVAYLFQARTYAAGALTAPVPPEPMLPALDYYLYEIRDGRWFSPFSIGWPAVLAIGTFLGVPWLVNPVLTALTVLLAHGIVRRVSTRELADLVAILVATSPWVLGTGGSLMTHATAQVALLTGWWCLIRAGDDNRAASLALALAGGLAMGWLFNTRQLEGLSLGTLTGMALLWMRGRRGFGQIPAYSLGCLATGMLFFAYNWAITGNPTEPPMEDYLNGYWGQGANAYRFGPNVGPPAGTWGALDLWHGHSPLEGTINTIHVATMLNIELFGWAFGSLAALIAAILWTRPFPLFARAMVVALVAVVGQQFFYHFTGSFYIGPRYWYIAMFPVVFLSAMGLIELGFLLPPATAARLPQVILLVVLTSSLAFTVWRGFTKYPAYANFHATVPKMAADGRFGNDVVFITSKGDIGPALALNDPFFRPDYPIFLPDRGEEANAAIMAVLPDRKATYITVDN